MVTKDKAKKASKNQNGKVVEGTARAIEDSKPQPELEDKALVPVRQTKKLVIGGSTKKPSTITAKNGATKKGPRIICIAGFAESTREMSNREPDDVEIWGLNRCYQFLKRWDRHFEVHEEDLVSGKTGLRESGYLDMLKESNVPVYMLHPISDIPQAVPFPMDAIVERFGRRYFTTSIALMIAQACYEGCDELHIYGVDMSAYEEYSYQRPCVEYWLGIAVGLGIKVTVPKEAPVLQGPMYGTHSEKVFWDQAKGRVTFLKSKQQQQQADLQAIMGAIAEHNNLPPFKDMEEITAEGLEEIKEWFKARIKELNQAQIALGAGLNNTLGAEREAQHNLTMVGAPQSLEEEPEAARLPQL